MSGPGQFNENGEEVELVRQLGKLCVKGEIRSRDHRSPARRASRHGLGGD